MAETTQVSADSLGEIPPVVRGDTAGTRAAHQPSAFGGWVPLVAVLGPGVLVCLLYVQRTYVDMVLLDGFIHVPFIGTALEPGGTLADLVRSPFAGEHLLLGYRLLLFGNAKLLSLDMRLDPIMFIAAFAVTAAVLYSDCARIFGRSNTARLSTAFLPLGFLTFSLVAPPLILMSTQFVWGATIALVIAWLVQRDPAWRRDEGTHPLRRPLWWSVALVPVYFLLSGAYFVGLLSGVAAMYLFRRLLERGPRGERRFFVLGAVLVAGALTYTWFMVHALEAQGRSASGNLTLPFADFRGLVLSYPAGIAGGLLDSHTLTSASSATVLAVGTFGLLLVVVSLWVFVKTRMYRKTYLPVYCIFYSLGIITVVHAGRGGISGNQGWRWITAEWYSFHLRFAVIGATWILLYGAVTHVQRGREGAASLRSWPLALATVGAVFVGGCQFVGNRAQWQRAPHVKEYYAQKRLALLYPQLFDEPEKVLLWPADQLAISRSVLKRHSLSSFSAESRSEVARGLERKNLRSPQWYSDDWVGRNGAALVTARTPRRVTLEAEVPPFIPRNRCEFHLNEVLIFAGEVRGGSTTTTSGRLRPDANLVVVKCEQALSPDSVGQGPDRRSLAVRVRIREG